EREAAKERIHNRARHAGVFELAILADAGGEQAHLYGIEHAPVGRDALEAVPLVTRLQLPGFLAAAKQVGARVLECNLASLRIRNRFDVPRLEKPGLLVRESAID